MTDNTYGKTSQTEHTAAKKQASVVGQAEKILKSVNSSECIDCPCGYTEDDAHMFESLPEEEMLYDLADLFKVFADTTRIKILYSLMGHDLCVADISEVVNATQSAVSHQLRILKQAHLVRFRRDGKNVIYSLADSHVYTMLAQGLSHICE